MNGEEEEEGKKEEEGKTARKFRQEFPPVSGLILSSVPVFHSRLLALGDAIFFAVRRT
jgi:hypothetical protein